MVRRDSFINKIRELDYSYKTQQKRTYLYRRKNSTSYICVPMADLLEDEFVAHSLRQAGCTEEQIRTFIVVCKS
ncbi:MAG: hypothetical protein A3H97_04620 [Acidobacteria bacterium RIFCSPLOWO2_02_FULL_65_29]|nr:MAG: hypothetical protein A3H97_04620 [Acidobacteria bacterium RIFCSPLOWO2_02_FULL_65_29]